MVKNEIFPWEFKKEWDRLTSECDYRFPPNKYVDLKVKTYNGVTEHIADMSWVKQFEILSCEQEREYTINDMPFISIADLEVKVKQDDSLAILDHKISTIFKPKDFKKKIKQLYTYSYIFHKVYGEFPKWLIFNHFKNNELIWHEFNHKTFVETLDWLKYKVDYIYKQTEFPARCSRVDSNKDFYAQYLCSHRNTCPFR